MKWIAVMLLAILVLVEVVLRLTVCIILTAMTFGIFLILVHDNRADFIMKPVFVSVLEEIVAR